MPKIDPRDSQPEPFTSLQQAAATFGVSVDTLRRRIQDGTLPAFRNGRLIRIRVSDLVTLFRPIPSARQAG